MAKINLLPWRENLRAQKQKQFLIALGATVALAALIVFAANFYMNQQISGQENRNNFLRSEIRKLERDIERIEQLEEVRDNLIARKNVIEQLQSNRNVMVHLFNSMAQTVPEGVTLTSVRQNNELLTIQGVSESETRVSDYMRNIEDAEWMSETRLNIVERENNENTPGQPYRFELQARVGPPKTDEVEEG
ncbi:PilN domain-containing protein [Wenzhouxiangella marina]|uniref:Fimbrial protein n=1 Tax=Wenzhouxiangella marina TaxID=1579979 RepID=A0A0K0XYU7_9GAMM|nr:PilN domain-containing protein [Wenzhouxiangella marina]AKS42845.1 Fimbrial protein [Wenzhouxiangella marina]MBB6087474.1 type IV pilus assembly protein PilN [Wenzhouxiangella marina]